MLIPINTLTIIQSMTGTSSILLAPTYEYYVKTQKPSKVEVVDKEKDFYIYHYNQTGYTKDGKSKKLNTQHLKIKTKSLLSCTRKISHNSVIRRS